MEQNSRLIDADALMQSEIKRCGRIPTIGTCYFDETSFKTILDQAPTVDAVEVVRCEKCAHGIPAEDADIPNCHMCVEAAEYDPESGLYAGFTSYHTGDFFCGYGERRNNG